MEKLEIRNLQDVAAFIYWISVEKGCVYHPDEAAKDYVFEDGELPVFTPYDARWIQEKIDTCNEYCESIGTGF